LAGDEAASYAEGFCVFGIKRKKFEHNYILIPGKTGEKQETSTYYEKETADVDGNECGCFSIFNTVAQKMEDIEKKKQQAKEKDCRVGYKDVPEREDHIVPIVSPPYGYNSIACPEPSGRRVDPF
jgi:hypothetical protein